MGRFKKVIQVSKSTELLSCKEKLEIISLSEQVFSCELAKIPVTELISKEPKKAEQIVKEFYESKQYKVYNSKTIDGYRCIGTEFYWQEYKCNLNAADKELVKRLKEILPAVEFRELAFAIKDKSGTPDLLLIKDNQIEFIEVKFNYETVKMSTVKFFLSYGERWPLSILRVLNK